MESGVRTVILRKPSESHPFLKETLHDRVRCCCVFLGFLIIAVGNQKTFNVGQRFHGKSLFLSEIAEYGFDQYVKPLEYMCRGADSRAYLAQDGKEWCESRRIVQHMFIKDGQ